MIKLLFLIPTLFLLSSCKNDTSNNDSHAIDQEKNTLLESVKKTSDEIKQDAYKSISVLNLDKENSFIEIEYVINKQTIADSTHQIYFLSYLVYRNEQLWNFETISIVYYIDDEKHNTHKRIITEDTKKLLALSLQSNTFNSMLKYCLNHFSVETVFELDIWIKNAYSRYPDDVLNSNFFELLETFSYECYRNIDSKDAKLTIVLIYVAIKHYIENEIGDYSFVESHKKTKNILEYLWQACENEKIEFAEHRLFGSVGDNW